MKLPPAKPGVSVYLDQLARLIFMSYLRGRCFYSLPPPRCNGGAVIAVFLPEWDRMVGAGLRFSRPRAQTVLAQDEASCVVWGMPGAVVNCGGSPDRVPYY